LSHGFLARHVDPAQPVAGGRASSRAGGRRTLEWGRRMARPIDAARSPFARASGRSARTASAARAFGARAGRARLATWRDLA